MTMIDLSFPATGETVPRDHGYALYAAITNALPPLHEVDWLGVHPIGGRSGGSLIHLSRKSSVRLRVPAEKIPAVLGLAGRRLSLNGSKVALGPPTVHSLDPASSLDARVVLLKLTRPPTRDSEHEGRRVHDNDAMATRYEEELRRQLSALDISGRIELCGRRTVTIRDKRLIGFSVRVSGLSSAASMRLQERGLGGRRAIGCGLFRPTRRP